MHRDEPDRLVGARLNAPLIVGVGEGESFLASDAAAIVAYTKNVIFLSDGDVADIRPGSATITDRSGAVLDRPIDVIPWSA
jgi:glucosamine--fructose-6-phosphate aminotransferase (isomerizing)